MTPEHLRQVEELYHAAREDPGALAHAGPELRFEVESLLVHQATPLPALVVGVSLTETTVVPGSQLGPYKIEGALGEGGMGQVFRARDTRLDSSVAIKLAHPEFVERSDFRHCFEREAKAVSALNHPHICGLYDIGDHEGAAYMVMEYVEGETLTEAMKKGLLPLDQALRYGMEIADALAAAHAQEIVHSDLKPGNIMVTATGVKVLDFGLAKQFSAGTAQAPTATMTAAQTQAGQVIGTVAYMSPEQAQGEPVDARSDVFSLGVVLYEMLCGCHPFRGDTTLMTLSAVLQTQPDHPRKLRPEIPVAVERIVVRCLEKQPELRYRSGGDLHRELLAARTSSVSGFRATRKTMVAAALAILAGTAAFGWRSHQRSSRIRWVEKTAVPEIAGLIQADRGLAALRLFRQAEAYSPASRSLFKLAEGVATRPVSFETAPAGAKIYVSDYTAAASEDLSEWQLLGEAPLTFDQLPNWGYYRVRAVKNGFAPADETFAGGRVQLTLQPEKAIPQGMVRIPASERPAFWMDRYEVTNRQYKQFVDAGGYQKQQYWKQPFIKDGRAIPWQRAITEFHDLTGRPGPAPWQLGAYPEGAGDVPVGGVSWYEAAAYAEFADKSLPTAAEWNQAAGIGFNSDIVQLSNFGGKATAAVGKYRGMAPFGTFDMAGNLKEWTTNAASDDRRYILGGAWDESPYAFTVPDARTPFARESTFGFRCVQRTTSPGDIYGPTAIFPPASRAITSVGDETYRVFLRLHAYERSPLDSRVERTDESSPYWRRETVSFRAAYGNERVIAHLFLPKDIAAPYQIVAMMGGSGITELKRIEDFDYPYEFILRSGRAVIIPAYSGTLERGPTPYTLPLSRERERALKWSMDLGRSIDFLETRTDIDARRIGFYGISSGAGHGARLIAVESRIKAAVFASGGLLRNQPPETDSWNFAPRVQIPVLMLNGKHDFILPVETNQNLLFQALGTKEPRKKHILYDGGHRNLVTRPDLIGEILDWLDRYLGPVQARQ